MTFLKHGFDSEFHQTELQEKDTPEIVALKWHLLQLELIKNNLDKTSLTVKQKQRAHELLQEIKQLSEPRLNPNKEAVEIGSVKALTDTWKSSQELCINDDNKSFIASFTDAAKAVGWNVEEVTRSERVLLVCSNDKGQKYVIFNPTMPFDSSVARFFNKTPESPQPSGRMSYWELVEPAHFADNIDFKIDVYIQQDSFTPGTYRVVKP